MNDSAACTCNYSLVHDAYMAFRPLINTSKSDIGFLVWQPIISYMPDQRTTDAQFTTLPITSQCHSQRFSSVKSGGRKLRENRLTQVHLENSHGIREKAPEWGLMVIDA